jgi:hypothetical protein
LSLAENWKVYSFNGGNVYKSNDITIIYSHSNVRFPRVSKAFVTKDSDFCQFVNPQDTLKKLRKLKKMVSKDTPRITVCKYETTAVNKELGSMTKDTGLFFNESVHMNYFYLEKILDCFHDDFVKIKLIGKNLCFSNDEKKILLCQMFSG